jgi:hypothetical protein
MYEGDSFMLVVRLSLQDVNTGINEPLDLTDCTFTAQIRESLVATNQLADFEIVKLDQSDPNTIGGLTMSLDAGVTTDMTSKGKYDLQGAWSDGTVKTYLRGDVMILPEVTR